jgi:glycosyltransferase involved in cell wall biosynthesis
MAQTIGIFTYKVHGMKQWDPDSITSGITGSEEAVIYMSQKLAKLGYKVYVFGNPPENSSHSLPEANPRYVDVLFDVGEILDIGIAWRTPKNATTLKKKARKVYLWPHDISNYTVESSEINGFDDVLWLSKWQRDQWISVNPGFAKFTKIFGNGVNPDQFKEPVERNNPYACIYSSNYGQGLEYLLDIWPTIKQKFPKATLDIYYGWKHWGFLSPEKEASMRSQIKNLALMGVHEHGLVGHDELNKAYEKASFWVYPLKNHETFCITALRAQLSGTIPVIIEKTALKETVRNGFTCTGPDGYCETLLKALSCAEVITVKERKKNGDFVRKEYTWEAIAKKWQALFDSEPIKVSRNLIDNLLPEICANNLSLANQSSSQ